MSKGTMVALAALVLSIITYGINDIQRAAKYEEKVDSLCIWKDASGKSVGKDMVQDVRLDSLENNVGTLVLKMEKLVDLLMEDRSG